MTSIFTKSIFLMSMLMHISSFAYLNPKSIIKKGTKIIYDVSYNGMQYSLDITIQEVENKFSFEWNTSKPLNKNGNIIIQKNATQNATTLFNFFTEDKAELVDQTSILISNKMFQNWQKNSSMEIYLDNEKNKKSIFGNGYDHTQNFQYKNDNSNEFNCRTVSDIDGYSITYLNDAEFPIIVEMHLDWSIKLRRIIN